MEIPGRSSDSRTEQTEAATAQAATAQDKPTRKLTVTYRDWRKHPRQAELIISKSKRIIVRAGRRGGKTVGAAMRAVIAFRMGRRVLYATPTQEQINKFWFEVTQALAELIDAGVVKKNESLHFVEVPGTENRIRAKTAWNADTLRGDYADLLILDEWQLMDESAWEDVGAPMLMDNNGDAVFIYTPPSLQSASVSKARDPRHAAKMFEKAEAEVAASLVETYCSRCRIVYKLAELAAPYCPRCESRLPKHREARWKTVHFPSSENPFIDADGLSEVTRDMTVASIRREILAQDTQTVPGALWTVDMIDASRVNYSQVPDLESVVVGLDPTGSSTNEAGVVACGKGGAPVNWTPSAAMLKLCPDLMTRKHVYVLVDRSLKTALPLAWAQAGVNLYFDVKADALLGERNYGGDMVRSTILQAENGDRVMYADVNATRGKQVRAAPVAAANQSGLVNFVGSMPELEDECTSYVPGGPSPNRMDAMVWGGIRLVEGVDAMGLVEFFKRLAEAGGDVAKVAGATPAIPLTACVACGCKTVVNGRCGECGTEQKQPPPPKTDLPVGQRGEWLATQSDETNFLRGAHSRGVFGRFGR